MFAPTKFKHNAGGPNTRPANSNSRNQFVAELNANSPKIFNRSFDTAQKLLSKDKNLKQTKLCLSRHTDESPCCSKTALNKETKPTEFFLMPMPKQTNSTTAMDMKTATKANLNKTLIGVPCELHPKQNELIQNELHAKTPDLQAKNGRSMVALIGQVDFCLKMHKVHPEISALWDVYGKLLKIIKGKHRGEHILLLRNSSGGPILQSVYFDFNNTLQYFKIDSMVHAVGRFVGENRLQTFKLQQLDAEEILSHNFTRIQNVISFVLLQNNIQNNETK